MKSWVPFVARRFLMVRRAKGARAARFGVAGIAAGVASMIVVLAVMNGFQAGTIQSILEINSFHIRFETDRDVSTWQHAAGLQHTAGQQPTAAPGTPPAILQQIQDAPGVTSVVPHADIQVMARGFWPEPQGMLIRAVPPDWMEQDAGARNIMAIVSGQFHLADDSIVLGAELARTLGLRVGDTLSATYIPDGQGRPADAQLRVAGLFRTGYLDIDGGWGFVSLAAADRTLGVRDPVVLGVKLQDRYRDAAQLGVLSSLADDRWYGESWRTFNRGIFGALRLEKSMMVFLLSLIFVVVAGNIYQVLRRSVTERMEDIAILRALGAAPQDIRGIFALEGWIIGLLGAGIGVGLGLAVVYNLDSIFAIIDAAARFIGQASSVVYSQAQLSVMGIPTRLDWQEVGLVALGGLLSAGLSSTLASRRVSRRMPMEVLR